MVPSIGLVRQNDLLEQHLTITKVVLCQAGWVVKLMSCSFALTHISSEM